MSFTKVYRFQDLNGFESVISRGNSDMTHMGFARILLNPGQTIEYTVTGQKQGHRPPTGRFHRLGGV